MMKKLIVLTAAVLFCSPAYAGLLEAGTSTTIGGATFKTSSAVNLDAESDASEYAAATKHTSGTFIYFSRSDATDITTVECAAGTDIDDDTVNGETVTTAACP